MEEKKERENEVEEFISPSQRVVNILQRQLRELHATEDPGKRDALDYWKWPSSPSPYTCNASHVSTKCNQNQGGDRTGLEEECFANWSRVRGRSFELVVADLDAAFIKSCKFHLEQRLRLGGGVRLMHQPVQHALLESLREERVHTYLVFGSYATFPSRDTCTSTMTGMCASLMEAFPDSWDSLRTQCEDENDENDDDENRESIGQAWIAEPEIPNSAPLTLLACAAYPRDQRPTEEEAAAKRWIRALKMIANKEKWFRDASGSGSVGVGKARGPGGVAGTGCASTLFPSSNKIQKIRVVTHAMGSFLGHDDVGVFATGLQSALDQFLGK